MINITNLRETLLRNDKIYNTLNKVFSDQNITKGEFLDLINVMSRIFSLEYSKINSEYPLFVILMNSIIQDARRLCIAQVPDMDIYDVMEYFVGK